MSIGQTFQEKYENFFNFFNQPRSLEEIKDFINKNNIPTNSQYQQINLNMIDSQNLNILFHIIKKSESDEDCLKKLQLLIEKYNVNYNGFDYIYHRKIPFYTCVKGYLKSTIYLIEKMDFNIRNFDSREQTIFFSAIKSYNIELMKYLDRKYPKWIFYPDSNYNSCIFMIFKKNMNIDDKKFKELLKFILNKGFDIEEKNNDNISFRDKCTYFQKDNLLYEVIKEIGGEIAEKYIKEMNDTNKNKKEQSIIMNNIKNNNELKVLNNNINNNNLYNNNLVNFSNSSIINSSDFNIESSMNDLDNKKPAMPAIRQKDIMCKYLSDNIQKKLINSKIIENKEQKEQKDNNGIKITQNKDIKSIKNKEKKITDNNIKEIIHDKSEESMKNKDIINPINRDKEVLYKSNKNIKINGNNDSNSNNSDVLKEKKDLSYMIKNKRNKGVLPINIINNNNDSARIKLNKKKQINNEKENNKSMYNAKNDNINNDNNNEKLFNNIQNNIGLNKGDIFLEKERSNYHINKKDINNFSFANDSKDVIDTSKSQIIMNHLALKKNKKININNLNNSNKNICKKKCCIFLGRKTKMIKKILDSEIRQELLNNKKLEKYLGKIKNN